MQNDSRKNLNLHPLGKKGAHGNDPPGRQTFDLYVKCQKQQGIGITSHEGSLFFPGILCFSRDLSMGSGHPPDSHAATQAADKFGINKLTPAIRAIDL